MIFDADRILSEIKEYSRILSEIDGYIADGKSNEADILIGDAFKVKIGVSEMMADFMTAPELIEFINRAGCSWAKIAFCAHLMVRAGLSRDKAAYLMDECTDNIDDEIMSNNFFTL